MLHMEVIVANLQNQLKVKFTPTYTNLGHHNKSIWYHIRNSTAD